MKTNWLTLSEQGYWVFPVKSKQKFPTSFGGKKWDEFIENKEHELLNAHLLNAGDATGAALCPQSNDPTRLLILDLDTYGADFDSIWHTICPDDTPPKGLGKVATASGGWHLWFKLPDDVPGEKLPATIDFGNGVKGEVRASAKNRRLIMLPESVAMNKHGRIGKYSGRLDVSTLPEPSPTLMARIRARKEQGKTEEGNTPTEVAHFLDTLRLLPDFHEGDRNNALAKIAQVLGRVHPAKGIPEDILDMLWGVLSTKLGRDFGRKEFNTTVISGFKTGSKNAEKYQAREKHPSVTDVKAECEGVFSSVPWLVEVRDSSGKTREWLAGLGGSPKRRHEADRLVRLKDLKEILPTLTRLTQADPDTVARSPLFIQPGWSKVLEYMLQTEKAVDQLGIPPEERFWELLDEWARISSGDRLFLEAWTEKRPAGAATAFIVWPLTEMEPPSLVIPPMLQETLLTQIGDIPKAKRLVSKHLTIKSLVGMRSGQKVWACSLDNITPETKEYCAAQYENFVRTKETKNEAEI
tara:strand:- start:4987 stop:6558 length:1572 start_codon:yes stop_codon:yes gene_type:complete